MKRAQKTAWIIVSVVFLVVGMLVGVPTFKKWRADELVDELCARDGGMQVYEVIQLPKTSAEALKRRPIPAKRLKKDSDEFYFVYASKDIIGKSNSDSIFALTVYRTEAALYRTRDEKLIGVAVGYARRGGDPFGSRHPSSYRCPPDATDEGLVRRVLIEKKD